MLRSTLMRAATLGMVAACVAGCGSKLSGKTPGQVLSTATSDLTAKGFQGTYTLDLSVDTSKAQGLGSYSSSIPSSLHASGTIDAQNSTHADITVNLNLQGKTTKVEVRVVGANTYTSTDGGATWTESTSPTASVPTSTITAAQSKIENDLSSDWKDDGSATVNGTASEHYQLVLDQAVFTTILGDVATSSSTSSSQSAVAQQYLPLVTKILTVGNGSVDAYVDTSTGDFTQTSVHLPLSINLTEISSLLGSFSSSLGSSGSSTVSSMKGTLGITIDATVDYTSVGGEAAVTAPTSHVTKKSTSSLLGTSGSTSMASFTGSSSTGASVSNVFSNISSGLNS